MSNEKEKLSPASTEHTPENVDQTKIKSNAGHKVEAVKGDDAPENTADRSLFGVGEDVTAGVTDAAANDPRVEARDVVRTAKTAEMAARVAATGYGAAAATLPVSELINSVPASPAAGQPLDIVAYEEYTAEVAALNAESAAAALKLSPAQRAQRIQELQRVSAEAYED